MPLDCSPAAARRRLPVRADLCLDRHLTTAPGAAREARRCGRVPRACARSPGPSWGLSSRRVAGPGRNAHSVGRCRLRRRVTLVPVPGRLLPVDRREIAREFGDRVRTLRVTRGMTQEDLAGASGLSRNQVQNIEHARNNVLDEHGRPGPANPTLETIWALAIALGVDAAELVRRAN
ncbi:helix-turn-helix domain-containing protein [Nocardioides nitrophenolicus]|uniref:helix-turn-helix domain-containing protein n=1 Tax=Nocardioides nitrophenolicus TaxID=60489 RepID=UPI0023BA8649|nr:helix-turn-helix transcriptional regulator [Nocardioides nitrophenolicus]